LDQLGIFLTGVLAARRRQRLGLPIDVVMGHSFGEIAALTAAGVLSMRAGAQVVCRRIKALQPFQGLGTLAAVSLDAERTRKAIEPWKELTVAGINHDRQTIVAGPLALLESLRDRLAAAGVALTLVPSRYPFHSPHLRG